MIIEILKIALDEIEKYLKESKSNYSISKIAMHVENHKLLSNISKEIYRNNPSLLLDNFVDNSQIVNNYFSRFIDNYTISLSNSDVRIIKTSFVDLVAKKLINEFCELGGLPYKNNDALMLFHFINNFLSNVAYDGNEKEKEVIQKWWYWLVVSYEIKIEISLKTIELLLKKITTNSITTFTFINELNETIYNKNIPNYVVALFFFLNNKIDLEKILYFFNSFFRLKSKQKNKTNIKFIDEGKQLVQKWFEVNNFSEMFIKTVFENNLLFRAVKNNFAEYGGYSNDAFFLFISLVSKNEEKKVSQILSKYFSIFLGEKWTQDKDKIIHMFSHKESFELATNNAFSFFGDDASLIKFELITDDELKNFFNETLKPNIKKMLDSHNVKNNIDNLKDFLLDNLFWKSQIKIIYYFITNNIQPKEQTLENYYYKIVYMFQFGNSISDFNKYGDLNISDEKSIILDSIKELNLKKFFIEKSYITISDLDGIDPIIFCSNNVLSTPSIIKFSWMEHAGDKLYSVIINDLILDAKINWKNMSYFENKEFQKNLFKTIFNEEIIQTSNLFFLIHKNTSYQEYSLADYFEAFIFWFFEKNGYEKTRDLVFNLICDCYDFIKIDDEIISFIESEIKDEKKIVNFNSPLSNSLKKMNIEYWYKVRDSDKYLLDCYKKASSIISNIFDFEVNKKYTFESYKNRDEKTIEFDVYYNRNSEHFVRDVYFYFKENGWEKTAQELRKVTNENN